MNLRRLFSVAAVIIAVALPVWADQPQLAVLQTVPTQNVAVAQTLNLKSYFGYQGVSGQLVQFDTIRGKFYVELLASAAPVSVANFLSYVNEGKYTDTIIHRSTRLTTDGNRIIQGGGYTYAIPPGVVERKLPIALEYNLPNARGTLAYARSNDPDTATSEWFFNVDDNSTVLNASNGGGYAVFGRVIGNGMTVVDALASIPAYDAGAPFSALPAIDVQGTQIQLENLVRVASIKPASVYPSSSGDPTVLSFSATSANPALLSAEVVGSDLVLTPSDQIGTTTVTVTATEAGGAAVQTTFTALVGPQSPVIVLQPASHLAPAGMPVVLRVEASGVPLAYQWKKDGTNIAGATRSSLLVNSAGSYTVTVSNGAGEVTSDAAAVSFTGSGTAGRVVNLSVRTDAGTGAKTLIVGFVVSGSGTQKLLVRGLGPTLGGLGVSDYLPDPRISVIPLGTGTTVDSNDNWGGDAEVANIGAQVGAYPLVSNSSKDAAVVFDTAAGGFTAQVLGAGSSTGIALAEIYDATLPENYATAPRLVNVSARAEVGTGEHILIAGFVITGDTSRTVLIRGLGPWLSGQGVTGVLADPQLKVFTVGGDAIATNDNWGGDATLKSISTTVGASALDSDASKDAALLVTLAPGVYTAQVSGVGNTTGVGLVELYEVQ